MRFVRLSLVLGLAILVTSCGLFVPRAKMMILTMKDSGQTINLELRQRFELALDAKYTWVLQAYDRTVLKQVVDITSVPGYQGVFEGIGTGETNFETFGFALCKDDPIPCSKPDLKFSIKVQVQ
ncbi:hypothetical protein HYR53_10670 [Candidatus Acetothermia bacterium]|nr:hypothetical protein [Candidatus Acetothermia bacterium]